MASNEVAAQIRVDLQRMEPQFKMALPAHIPPERFLRVAMTAVQNNPTLLECDRASLFAATMKAAQDGLLPDGREGAIIPKKGAAVWMPMVAGVLKKVRNSGEISTWSVHEVCERDEFDFELGDSERIYHKPRLSERGKIIAAYSIVKMKDGEVSREVMGMDEIQAIMERSDGYQYAKKNNKQNPWISDFSEMAKKTVIRRHAKRLPSSTDLDGLLPHDDPMYTTEPEASVASATPAAPSENAPRRGRPPSRLQAVAAQQAAPVTVTQEPMPAWAEPEIDQPAPLAAVAPVSASAPLSSMFPEDDDSPI